MRKLKLYLETSVWNFMFADDAPEKKRATQAFFQEVLEGRHDIFISETVLFEIHEAPDMKRALLLELIDKHKPILLSLEPDVLFLVSKYIEMGVLKERHARDLQHAATASLNTLDALLSWNLKHLVKMKTQSMINAVNRSLGYRDIEIRTPQEVTEYEQD